MNCCFPTAAPAPARDLCIICAGRRAVWCASSRWNTNTNTNRDKNSNTDTNTKRVRPSLHNLRRTPYCVGYKRSLIENIWQKNMIKHLENLVWKLSKYSHRYPPQSNGNGNDFLWQIWGLIFFTIHSLKFLGRVWSAMQLKDVVTMD